MRSDLVVQERYDERKETTRFGLQGKGVGASVTQYLCTSIVSHIYADDIRLMWMLMDDGR